MGNSLKVQVDDVHSLTFIHQTGHLVIEVDQVGQAGPAFHEPMLAGPDPLVVLHMLTVLTQLTVRFWGKDTGIMLPRKARL